MGRANNRKNSKVSRNAPKKGRDEEDEKDYLENQPKAAKSPKKKTNPAIEDTNVRRFSFEESLNSPTPSSNTKPAFLQGQKQTNNWVAPTSVELESGTRRRSVAFNQIKYNVEGLGEDFEETPWVPPSTALAKEYRTENILKGGKAKLHEVDVTKEQECGNGVPLFFLFIYIMGIAFFICTILSIPSMIFTVSGTRIDVADRDSLGLYKLTIGNLGFSTGEPNYDVLSSCGTDALVNSTCITAVGMKFTMEEVGQIITAFEFLQVLVYFIAFFYLYYRTYRFTTSSTGRDCVVSDYSVMVEDIPADTTIENLIAHFSNIYQLSKPDWAGRPPLRGAQTVVCYDNTEVDIHYNTWIAEVTVFKKIGSYIRAFKQETQVLNDLKRARAFMKMKWESVMLRLGSELDTLTEQLMYHNKKAGASSRNVLQSTQKNLMDNSRPKTPGKSNGNGKGLGNGSSGSADALEAATAAGLGHIHSLRRKSISDSLEAEPFCAFVVFNYSESMARCLEDYEGYSKFPWNLCYPSRLKFRGQRIKVRQAPEPDEIIWENLEIAPKTKFWARVWSTIVSFVLIIIGFAIILQSAAYQSRVKETTPHLGLCKAEIPSMFKGSYDVDQKVSLTRPSTSPDSKGLTRIDYDNRCKALVPDSFFLFYALPDSYIPFGTYDIAACATKITTSIKRLSVPVSPPLIPPHARHWDAVRLLLRTIVEHLVLLMCLITMLKNFFTAEGVNNGISSIQSGSSSTSTDPCSNFFKSYVTAKVLTYVAALATVVTNIILKTFIFWSTKKEYFNTTDIETGNIIKKIFLILYVNMALVVLFAFGYLKGGHNSLSTTQILNGDYNDFTSSWYGQVGTYLIVTFVLNSVASLIIVLPKYFIFQPWRIYWTFPKIEKKKGHSMAMQDDLNKLVVGNTFRNTSHYAQLTALLFFGMMYAPGIPIFMPLLCASFILYYYFDKLLLLRFYKKPPHMSDGASKIILGILPYAGFIRLAVGMWMYGNDAIITSGSADISILPGYSAADPQHAAENYQNYLEEHKSDQSLLFRFESRIIRANVFPLFVLFCIFIAVKVIQKLLEHLPLYFIMENLGYLYKAMARCCCGAKKEADYVGHADEEGFVQPTELIQLNHPLRREMAPYTEVYYKYIKPTNEVLSGCAKFLNRFYKSKTVLGQAEEAMGWAIVEQDDWIVKIKKWTEDVKIDGLGTYIKGTYKRTFEVVSDHGCFSYALDRIPAYTQAVKGLRDNINDYNFDETDPNKVKRKYETQENIVERFMKDKHEKEAKFQHKLEEELAEMKSAAKSQNKAKNGKNGPISPKVVPTAKAVAAIHQKQYSQAASTNIKKSIARNALEESSLV
eukprot:gene4298-8544_t